LNKYSTSGLFVGALALLFSAGAYSFGGGGSGGGGDDGLPAPETCTSTSNVGRSVDGFGGGTIYYPTNTSGEMAAIAVSPGFTAGRSAIAWWGPVLASHGFIVIAIDTNSRFDQPISRGRQLDSALSYLISEGNNSNSPLFGRVDENRLAAMGHSMGGGGALRSAARNRLSAAIPLAPFNVGGTSFNNINVPTMIVACESDGTAPVRVHASPFYNPIPGSTDKVFLEINNGPHNCGNGGANNDALLSTYGVSWMKRFLDKDRRYNQFLCGPNHQANRSISEFRDTCNF